MPIPTDRVHGGYINTPISTGDIVENSWEVVEKASCWEYSWEVSLAK